MKHVEDYIRGLPQIEFHLGSNRDLPAWSLATQEDRGHVAVLEGLALLLVFNPKGRCGGDIVLANSRRIKTPMGEKPAC